MRTLRLVRHAEIDNDGGRRFVGVTDPPLTPRGEAQARALSLRLLDLSCPVHSSPLERARATARALGGKAPVLLLEGLREIDFGAWEGRLAEEVSREAPEAYARWQALDPGFAFPGGESLHDAARRMGSSLAALLEGEGEVLAVAHGGVLRLGLCEVLSLPWGIALPLRNDFAGITRLERHAGHLVLAALNDTAHLDRIPA